jgi:hypothetical protein
MLQYGGAKILPVIPHLIIPIKSKHNLPLFIRNSGFKHKRPGDHCNHLKGFAGTINVIQFGWRGFSALFPPNFTGS